MANGISIKLHNGTTPLVNQTDLKVLMWEGSDVTNEDDAIGIRNKASTDASGFLTLDITRVSEATIGHKVYVIVRKEATPSEDALVFQGIITVSDVGTGKEYLKTNFAYQRPDDFLTMTGLPTGGQNKCVFLFAVFERDPNYVAMNFTCTGGVTVDWGTGAPTEDFASNAAIQKSVLWSEAPPASLTTRGFRQIQITVTPTVPGNAITKVDPTDRPTGSSSATSSSNFLEMYIDCPSMNNLAIYGAGSAIVHRRLETIILWPTALTTLSNGFRDCTALRYIELDTTGWTSHASLFYGCSQLKAIPWMDMSVSTSLNSFANTCTVLQRMPANLNTPLVNNTANMFVGCANISKIPAFDVSKVTDATNMFGSTANLQEIGSGFVFTECLNHTNMFSGSAIKRLTAVYGTKGTNFATMFNNTINIKEIPAINMSLGTTMGNSVFNGVSICSIDCTGMKTSFSISACNLSATEMNNVFTNLATVTGQTITITGNTYAINGAGYDPTIATAKGWTVTA